MEHVGYDPGVVHSSVHAELDGVFWTNSGFKDPTKLSNLSNFNTYTLDWNENRLKFYVNGYLIGAHYKSDFLKFRPSEDWPFDSNFHIILNTAVGGKKCSKCEWIFFKSTFYPIRFFNAVRYLANVYPLKEYCCQKF